MSKRICFFAALAASHAEGTPRSATRYWISSESWASLAPLPFFKPLDNARS